MLQQQKRDLLQAGRSEWFAWI